MSNRIGTILQLTTFGESHGLSIGGIIDGFPAGMCVDLEAIALEMSLRNPRVSHYATTRREDDTVKLLSGIFNGITTGAPIAFCIDNHDAEGKDYEALKDLYRPSHADYTYQEKYGIRDYRGGGRASARETATWVAAGALAKQYLRHHNIVIQGYVTQIGEVSTNIHPDKPCRDIILQNMLRCPDELAARDMLSVLQRVAAEGDTIGGVVSCSIFNLPVGLGEPIFDKFHAKLAHAMMSIPAAKGFEYGAGFDAAAHVGSSVNDTFVVIDDKIRTSTNYSGGIQGGISNGEEVYFKVAFKPIPSMAKAQDTIRYDKSAESVAIKGRHDVCALPRAVAVVEAMAALVTMDMLLMNMTTKIPY